jgi:hypothetical protein
LAVNQIFQRIDPGLGPSQVKVDCLVVHTSTRSCASTLRPCRAESSGNQIIDRDHPGLAIEAGVRESAGSTGPDNGVLTAARQFGRFALGHQTLPGPFVPLVPGAGD